MRMMGPRDETNPLKRTNPYREGPDSKPLCFRTVCVFAADLCKVEQRRESWQGARGQGFAGRVNVGHSTTPRGQQQTREGAQPCPTETTPCTPVLDRTQATLPKQTNQTLRELFNTVSKSVRIEYP